MDLKLQTEQGNFQILSISDKKANVSKPDWFQKGGIGYIIQSHVGKLELFAKTSVEGQLSFRLRGISVYNPKDKTKRIPHWIGYTKFVVNEKVIFDKMTPAWHDKPCNYALNVEANKEIRIQVEWLPHSENSLAPAVQNQTAAALDKKFLPYITSRLDLKMMTGGKGNLQIVSVSDNDAAVKKATWLPKNEAGYFIQSHVGQMEVIAKATMDGQIRFSLRSSDVRYEEDNKKCIPYWIDYTKFAVNGKIIFDKVTPTWHDKPYNYALNVEAGKEIKIQVEWLPHRSDVPAVAPPEKVELPVADKFLPYLTGRTDIQLTPKTGTGDLQILSVSDDKANVRKADWLPKNTVGYFIQSHVGKLKIVAKPNADGKVQLKLKGVDVRSSKDKSKRIPYWIDYTKLAVNDKIIFDKLTPVWHDKSYSYTLETKAGEEIAIETEWLPHRSES